MNGNERVKAVVLVGGLGTRLRPLTETIPKPLIPLVDRPFLHHVLDHLSRHGVEEVILSSPHLRTAFDSFISERRGDPAVRWMEEKSPLGTGGAVVDAAQHLDGTFVVSNGDILTDLDVSGLVAFHRENGSAATIALTAVDDARPYGLVEVEGGRIAAFKEKPTLPGPGLVNAGTYVLEPGALKGLPSHRPLSIERDVFPGLIASGAPVFGFTSSAYWMDLGTLGKYLQATFDVLSGRVKALHYPAPFVDPRAVVSPRCRLGKWTVAGPASEFGGESDVDRSVVLARARVEPGARVRDSVIGPGALVRAGSVVEGAVIGANQVVAAGVEAASQAGPT